MATCRGALRQVATACAAVLAAACSEAPSGPVAATVDVAVETTGGDLDLDGYFVELTSGASIPIGVVGDHVRLDLPAGTHVIALGGVAANCAVSGTHPRSVTVGNGETLQLTFVVICEVAGFAVLTRTSGQDNPASYELTLNGTRWRRVFPNDSVLVTRLAPGSYTVSVSVYGDHCSIAEGPTRVLEVVRGTVTPLLFAVTCTAALRAEKIALVIDTVVDGRYAPWMATVRPDGSRLTLLQPGTAPAWRPDGTTLAASNTECAVGDWYYYTICSGGMMLVDPETLNTTPLPIGPGYDPSWSPAGDAIAYAVPDPDSYSVVVDRLYIYRLGDSAAVRIPVDWDEVSEPAWAPDGRRIAFACSGGILVNPAICIVGADGTGMVRLTSDSAALRNPAWSPDGGTIAAGRYENGNWTVILANVGDGSIRELTTGRDPAWSADGSRLVFAGDDGIFVIGADGSNRTRLTTGAHRAPAWRP